MWCCVCVLVLALRFVSNVTAYTVASTQIRILDKRNRSLISENESLIAAHASAVEASSRAEQGRASTQSRIQDLHDQLGGLKSAWEAEFSARLSEQSAEVAALKQQLARKVDAYAMLNGHFVWFQYVEGTLVFV